MRIFKFITILILFFSFAHANVKLDAKSFFIKGEAYTFSIIATGKDITFPKIENINKESVNTISTQNSISIINSKVEKKIIKRFSFFPNEEFVLPSFEFEIDGKKYKTKSLEVKSKKIEKSDFKFADFEISSSKSSVYVAQEFKLKVKFKYKEDLNVQDLNISNANFKDFWYKQTDNSKQYKEDGFIVNELEFLLFAQKSGKLRIEPFKITMQLLDINSSNFFMNNNYITKQIYSNDLEIDAKPLPQGANLMGSFDIETSLDKTQINQGDAVSYKIKVSGYGNIDDINDFTLDIKDAQVFENKATIDTKIKDDKLYGTYEKSFSIIPKNSIKLKSLELKYFDSETKKIVRKKTDSYEINVKKAKEKKSQLITPKKDNVIVKEVIKTSIKDRVVFFLLGFIFALLIVYLYKYVITKKLKKQKESTLLVKIKSSKTSDELIKVLAFMIKKDESLDRLIFKLQKIENNEEFKILKKDIYSLVKQIEKGKK
ncbi:BatD family protein [Malaciobacter marinus]|jgi:uncharacterized protein YrzB (UPF0473 family)|uniref:Oxygen tolerance protein BatD n=1 Tax=Malaciobacter marinus TaxID=505249 RepID=A0AB36ZYJ6_9BACT|nr:BatD family protein [Malaciobacter marinus]PPK62464.1 oxygen tolerance protein BatD [Malaciobacter marinus]SKB24977.1 Oxygen tolerance [Malaciobacter marinus]